MLKRTVTIALLCLLPIACAAAAVAAEAATDDATQPVRPVPRPVPMVRMPSPYLCVTSMMRLLQPHVMPMLTARLKLTEQQQTEVTDLLTKAEEQSAAKIEAQRNAATNFALMMGKEDVTEAALKDAADQAMKAETELFDAKIKTFFALKSKLTPEQNKQLAELFKQYSNPWLPSEMRAPVSLGRPDTPKEKVKQPEAEN